MPVTRSTKSVKSDRNLRQVPPSVSRAGSSIGSSRSARLSAIKADAELRISAIEKEEVEVELAAQRKLLNIRRKEVEVRLSAQISELLLDEDHQSDNHVATPSERIESYLQDCSNNLPSKEPADCGLEPKAVSLQPHFQAWPSTTVLRPNSNPAIETVTFDLPKVELQNFDGNVVREQTLSEETLRTLFVKAESIINQRPLVPPPSDCCDMDPLTPNDLLMVGGAALTVEAPDLCAKYSKRWRQVQHLASVFWKRWLREYLPTLQARQKWDPEKIRNAATAQKTNWHFNPPCSSHRGGVWESTRC